MLYDSEDQDYSNLLEHAFDPWHFGNRPGDGSNGAPGVGALRASLRDARTSAGFPITPGLSPTQRELNSSISFSASGRDNKATRDFHNVALSRCVTL